jgi:hypothetical protein
MIGLCERFGCYGTYAEERSAVDFGGLPQRYDAAANFVRSGGRFARQEPAAVLASRTNYFRETYAYSEPRVPGIEGFLRHEGFIEAARRLHGRPVVRPAIVYANLLIPGQELAVHTDVPEFRGANRLRYPQWLLVVMHHSGLFERWRMPIATGVAWFGECKGGAFAFWPEGPAGPPRTLPARHDTACLLDTDSVFHGVDRVAESVPLPPVRPGTSLCFEGDGRWALVQEERVLTRYRREEIRFSVSWKAHCYADEAERRAAEQHDDDLELALILAILTGDLRERGHLGAEAPTEGQLALRLIDEYVRFPEPAAPEARSR